MKFQIITYFYAKIKGGEIKGVTKVKCRKHLLHTARNVCI